MTCSASLAALVLALDHHVIVLGGGLSQYAPLYQQLPPFNGVRVPPIVPPRFGDAGGTWCRPARLPTLVFLISGA